VIRALSVACTLWAVVAQASAPELEQAFALYQQGQSAAALPLLGKIAQNLDASPEDRAHAYLYGGLCRAGLGDPVAARRNFVNAFSLDPSLALPDGTASAVVELASSSRTEAISALDLRLGAAARSAQQTLLGVPAPPPPPPAVASEPKAPPPAVVEEEKPEKEEPPPFRAPPTLLRSHLGAGTHGFYVVGDKTAGAAIDITAGGRVGQSLWIGGVGSLWLGTALAGSLALRLSSYSDKPVAYLLGAEAGGLYSSGKDAFFPVVTVHPLGLAVRTQVLIIEARVSLSLLLTPQGLRWTPSGGVAVLF
jgi:tetratricopeptide (TPR) repeat protein